MTEYAGEGILSEKTLPLLYEHIIASTYGYKLEYIRTLAAEEVKIHAYMCAITKQVQIEQTMTGSFSRMMQNTGQGQQPQRKSKRKRPTKGFDPKTKKFG